MNCLCLLLAVIFTLVLTKSAQAQELNKHIAVPDTAKPAVNSLAKDTIATDSALKKNDSLAKKGLEDSLGIKISPDALPEEVTSQAADSAVMDMKKNVFYLYGNAQVNYQDLQLNAGEITYKQENNLVTAAPSFDSSGLSKERPSFTQGQEKFTYDSLQYNFKSKRAIVRNARTQYGEGFVHSEQVKRNPDQSIYGLHSIYTTCSLDTPHFGIRAQKIKVIPNKVIASGPANFTIEQVPTPIFLPFGLFPITQGQHSGLKMPTYTIEETRGIGLVNGGYYFALGQYADLLLESNLYSRGSYSVSGVSTYINRYRYTGGLSFTYAYNKQGEAYEPGYTVAKDFNVQWRHQSDPKSRPGTNFNASVIFGTSTFNANNTYTASQILQNQYQSNITYSKNWQNKPYSLTVGARHSQNTQSHLVDVTLPELSFYLAQFNPFQLKGSSGTKWYEKITAQYSLSAVNKISFYDSTFSFNTLAFNDFENGIKHNIPISASYNVLRFINMNFGVNYNEYWLTRQTYHYYNPATDTINTNIYRGFFAARDFNASVGANTRIYGLKMFKKGKLAGIRHMLTPSASLTYTPDFAASPFNYGYRTLTNAAVPEYLPVYENTIGYTPSRQFGKFSSLLAFGIDNNLQIKVRTKDSVGTKNIRLIDNFRINTAYDLAKDSFKWSPIAMSFATNLYNLINITANAVFDPYDFDTAANRDISHTLWSVGKGIARFKTASASVGGSLRSVTAGSQKKAEGSDELSRMLAYGRYNDYVDFNIPWNFSFTYSLQLTKDYLRFSRKDTLVLNHSIMFFGDFNLTPKWKITFSSGYNLTQKQLQITSIDIYRDLHCWEMRMGTIPFGPRKSYNFTINVKAQVLQDLRLIRRRDFRDAI